MCRATFPFDVGIKKVVHWARVPKMIEDAFLLWPCVSRPLRSFQAFGQSMLRVLMPDGSGFPCCSTTSPRMRIVDALVFQGPSEPEKQVSVKPRGSKPSEWVYKG